MALTNKRKDLTAKVKIFMETKKEGKKTVEMESLVNSFIEDKKLLGPVNVGIDAQYGYLIVTYEE